LDVIFTIVSRNYAALAQTLMQSLAQAEPRARRVVVAADGPIPSLTPFAEVIEAAEVCEHFADMCVYYEALELNTAVKPYAFRALMARDGVESVTYLDPDIFVFRPLERVRQGLDRADLVLTPHLTRPLVGDASPNDHAILKSGSYNLGFASMRKAEKTAGLIDWWAARCRFDCRVDLKDGLFTDQRWMDLAPGFVDSVDLIREPGLNLAYWNLEGRELSRAADGWRVDGEPLAFFHFSGFDPARPRTLSKHQDRLSVAAGSPLAALLADYGQALLKNGHEDSRKVPYAHDRFGDGRRVTRTMRRRALRAARAGERFDDGLAGASAWMDEADPEMHLPGLPDVTRVVDQAWRDHPAGDAFDRGSAEGRTGFLRWFADNAEAAGADDHAVRAAERIAEAGGGGGREADPEAWRDAPWTGPASEVAAWLREAHEPPRAVTALLAARKDLRRRFGGEPDRLLAWCIGPEAAAGRFSLDLLPEATLSRLAGNPEILAEAARLADPAGGGGELRRRLSVGFGVGARAGWPERLIAPLQAPYLTAAEGLRAPFVGLFAEIWKSRPDLQRLYPLATAKGRFRFLRWLLAGGLKEYGVDPAALPAAVRDHPLMRLAPLSLRGRASRASGRTSPGGQAARLYVVEAAEAAPAGAVYEASRGRFRGRAPAQVDEVVFLTAPTFVAADAISLMAQGLRWRRAVGAWDAAAVAALRVDSPALSFVDEIWTAAPVRDDLPRPVVTRAIPVA
jgi:hypothetical protein